MIVTATKENISDAAELALALWPDNDTAALTSEIAEMVSDLSALVAIFYSDKTPAGLAICQLRHDYVEGTSSSPVGYLEGVYVKDEFRRQGAAAQLLAYCESWAKKEGCREFASDCQIDNTDSLLFHKAAGFEEAGRIICFCKKL